MFFSSKTISVALLAIFLGALQFDSLEAQTPAAPRVFRPKSRMISSRYMRPQSNSIATGTVVRGQPAIGEGAIIYEEPIGTGTVAGNYSASASNCSSCTGHVVGGPVEQVIGGDCCGTCFDDCCGGCNEIDCRDCGIDPDCWANGLGGILRNGTYFTGVQAFKGQFTVDPNLRTSEPCSFGYQLGMNTGIPLYKLTCGLLTGQIGFRYVRSNFEGDLFSSNTRNQTFFTTGLYRRVDYGFQFGAVVDILNEDWVAQLDLVQVRAELSWVYSCGHTFGFRSANGVQNDEAQGQIGGLLPNINGDLLDTYRFFYRHACVGGGFYEAHLGWSDENHTVLGMDFDLPLGCNTALQTGFTYLAPDENLQFVENEAWNLYMGVSWRPRGKGWYRFYHRPMFPVADNGSMLIRRQ